MRFKREQEKKLLIGLVALLVLLNGYSVLFREQPRRAPLTYSRGAVANSPIRPGLLSREGGADPLNVFLAHREEKYPGVSRDIFKMEHPAPRPVPVAPPPLVVTAPTPTVPEKTPEQIAEDEARADLSKFRFLGFLTDKDNTLFLSKDEELFMVKSGDRILKNYRIKEAGKDYVVLLDTLTRVEVRIELTGGEQASPAPAAPVRQPIPQPQRVR